MNNQNKLHLQLLGICYLLHCFCSDVRKYASQIEEQTPILSPTTTNNPRIELAAKWGTSTVSGLREESTEIGNIIKELEVVTSENFAPTVVVAITANDTARRNVQMSLQDVVNVLEEHKQTFQVLQNVGGFGSEHMEQEFQAQILGFAKQIAYIQASIADFALEVL